MKYFLWIALLLLIWMPAGAHAGDLTLFGGVQQPGDLTFENAVDTVPDTVEQAFEDPGNFGLFGLRVNRSNAPLALEHTFAYSPRFIETESSALIYNTNLLLQTPVSGIQPFATAGIGVVSTWGGGPGDIGSKFQVNYGGGIKLRIFGLAGLRVDVRGYSIRDVYEESLHVFESSIGLLFAF